jgi:hypothetical protein
VVVSLLRALGEKGLLCVQTLANTKEDLVKAIVREHSRDIKADWMIPLAQVSYPNGL